MYSPRFEYINYESNYREYTVEINFVIIYNVLKQKLYLFKSAKKIACFMEIKRQKALAIKPDDFQVDFVVTRLIPSPGRFVRFDIVFLIKNDF